MTGTNGTGVNAGVVNNAGGTDYNGQLAGQIGTNGSAYALGGDNASGNLGAGGGWAEQGGQGLAGQYGAEAGHDSGSSMPGTSGAESHDGSTDHRLAGTGSPSVVTGMGVLALMLVISGAALLGHRRRI